MGSASDWLREERRKTLGDWVAFCLGCGHAQRYFEENEGELPADCPTCGGELRSRCPACGARFSSVFAVECEGCGGALRAATQFGVSIRQAKPS
jgi:ribosomal protein S27E